MKNTAFLILLLFASLSLGACSQKSPNTTNNLQLSTNNQPLSPEEQLRLDIGEMLLVGFRGTSVNESSQIVKDIQEYHVGSVILFEYDAPTGTRHRNIESPTQLKKLCADLQSFADGQLLIGVDQEGGNVARLRNKDGFPATKTAQKSAEEGDASVRRNAQIVAQELAEAGINLNFAPCTDVNVNTACPIIGKLGRSFSSDPQRVAECARIWIDEQGRQNVISCLKHFPGHGSANGDTHAGLVDVSTTWQDTELEPYRLLIANGDIEMVMVAHVINSQLGDKLPASLSPKVVKEKLRNELGFNGVVVTDDLAMGAISRQYGFEEAIKMAILAGCDLLCLSNNGGGTYDPKMVARAVNAIINFVDKGELSAEDIHTAAERIRSLKKNRIKKS